MKINEFRNAHPSAKKKNRLENNFCPSDVMSIVKLCPL